MMTASERMLLGMWRAGFVAWFSEVTGIGPPWLIEADVRTSGAWRAGQ